MPAKKKSIKKKRTPAASSAKRLLVFETRGGRTITLSDSAASIEIDDGNGNVIKLEPAGITIRATGKLRVNASEIVVSAGVVTIDAGTSKFNGLVQCDALVSNSVTSASYSPGVGNIW